MQLYSHEMRGWIHPADAFVTLYGSDENAFWLDRENHWNPYSVMGHAYGNKTTSTVEMFKALAERKVWNSDTLESAPRVAPRTPANLPFAYRPGFVGWLDYQQDPLSQPNSVNQEASGTWLEVREALVFDHAAKSIFFVGYFETEDQFQHWLQAALLRLSLCGGQQISYRMRNAPKGPSMPVSLAHSDAAYLELIAQAQRHIALGDVYQLCLTNQIQLSHQSDPLEVFLRLRDSNPAPYAAFIRAGEQALVCSSPEQFLSLSARGKLSTRPIKGTRPRHADPIIDAEFAAELAQNLKERAENLMIVDLMRNDLGRVSEPNSVTVTELFKVEPYATVHQLVSTVESQLAPGFGLQDVLNAAFPGGSMTGAPKIRAMQLINQLEGVPRGVYSGAAGHIGIDGSADLGMVIRSLLFSGQQDSPTKRVSIGVGGGITIDSDPAAELEETKLKASALLAVLGSSDPWSAPL